LFDDEGGGSGSMIVVVIESEIRTLAGELLLRARRTLLRRLA